MTPHHSIALLPAETRYPQYAAAWAVSCIDDRDAEYDAVWLGRFLCEWAVDYEDDATDYMNDHYPVDGHFWGRNEFTGDWGLWADEQADEQEGDL